MTVMYQRQIRQICYRISQPGHVYPSLRPALLQNAAGVTLASLPGDRKITNNTAYGPGHLNTAETRRGDIIGLLRINVQGRRYFTMISPDSR